MTFWKVPILAAVQHRAVLTLNTVFFFWSKSPVCLSVAVILADRPSLRQGECATPEATLAR